MHSCIPQSGALASVAAEAATRNGCESVVVWLPRLPGRGNCFDVYVCERLSDGTYRVHARIGTVCCDDHGFSRDGATWHAQLAGAGFKRFRQRVPHGSAVRGQARLIMPSGQIVGAV